MENRSGVCVWPSCGGGARTRWRVDLRTSAIFQFVSRIDILSVGNQPAVGPAHQKVADVEYYGTWDWWHWEKMTWFAWVLNFEAPQFIFGVLEE